MYPYVQVWVILQIVDLQTERSSCWLKSKYEVMFRNLAVIFMIKEYEKLRGGREFLLILPRGAQVFIKLAKGRASQKV